MIYSEVPVSTGRAGGLLFASGRGFRRSRGPVLVVSVRGPLARFLCAQAGASFREMYAYGAASGISPNLLTRSSQRSSRFSAACRLR